MFTPAFKPKRVLTSIGVRKTGCGVLLPIGWLCAITAIPANNAAVTKLLFFINLCFFIAYPLYKKKAATAACGKLLKYFFILNVLCGYGSTNKKHPVEKHCF